MFLIRFFSRTVAMLLSCTFAQVILFPFSASAYTASDPYTIRFALDRTVISTDELASGDVVLSAAVYLTGSTENTFAAIQLAYQADSDDLHFQNLIVGDSTSLQDEEITYESSQGTFTTPYLPYCFGYLVGSRYSTGNPLIVTNAESYDVNSGSLLYSTGTGSVQFTINYYKGVERDDGLVQDTETGLITETITCPVTAEADGSGSYSYFYINQGTYETETIQGTIPDYTYAWLPEGTVIPGECNQLIWEAVGQILNGASFFGDTSDEFPFFYVEIVVEQGTPEGVYTVYFDEGVSDNGTPLCMMKDVDGNDYDFDTESVVITVTDDLVDDGETLLGDVNADGEVNVTDAYLALVEYANVSAGHAETFDTAQFTAADVNQDGMLTITDALYILQYYADSAAGNPKDWTDYQ